LYAGEERNSWEPVREPPYGAWLSLELPPFHRRYRINEANRHGVFSFHPGGAYAVMCDGAVHFLNERIDQDTLSGNRSRVGGAFLGFGARKLVLAWGAGLA
jgi:hypothetical protein